MHEMSDRHELCRTKLSASAPDLAASSSYIWRPSLQRSVRIISTRPAKHGADVSPCSLAVLQSTVLHRSSKNTIHFTHSLPFLVLIPLLRSLLTIHRDWLP
jgi:hypothetical protein